MMKKTTAFLLAICLLIPLLVSCADSPIEVYVGGAPEAIDPAKIKTKADEIYISNMFSGLYEYAPDENGMYNISPADAEGFPTSRENEDGSYTVVIKLKSGLLWSNGEPITPEDYVYSWNRAAESYIGSEREYVFRVFKGFEDFLDPDIAEPKLSLEFDNKSGIITANVTDDVLFLEYTTLPCMFPVSRIALRDDPEWNKSKDSFASNGAFKLSKISKDKLVCEKNGKYRNAASQITDEVTFIFNENSAKSKVQKGKIDFAFTESGKNKSTDTGITFLAFNAHDAAIGAFKEADQLRIRKAIALYAVNSGAFPDAPKGIVPTLSSGISASNPGGGDHGGGAPESPEGIDHGMSSTDYADYLMEKAAESELFTWQEGKAYEFPILTAICAGREGEERALEKISEALREKGIVLKIRNLTWNEFLDERDAGAFSLLINSWSYSSSNQAEILRNFISDSIYNDTRAGIEISDGWKEKYDSILSFGIESIESANVFYKSAISEIEKAVLLQPLAVNSRNLYVREGLGIQLLKNGIVLFK